MFIIPKRRYYSCSYSYGKTLKMRFSFPSFSRFLRHPVVEVFAYGSVVVGSFGVYDFNRSIQLSEDDIKNFKSLNSLSNDEELVEVSIKLHFKALHKALEFRDIKSSRDLSIELFYLYKRVEKSKLRLKNLNENERDSDEQLGDDAAQTNMSLCQQMCRRTLIRNGHVAMWFQLLVQDQFIQIY